MSVHLTTKDKLKVVLIAAAIIAFMGVIAILAACNFFEHFTLDYCSAACMKLFPDKCV